MVPPATVLGFDTATARTAVGLIAPGRDPVERVHDPAPGERPGHASQLLALVEAVLTAGDTTWEAVDRIAVGVGPGTFTGLRIGVATARGLAHARGIEVAAVSTLAALAAGARAGGEAGRDADAGRADEAGVLAVIDARRGEVFAAAHPGPEALRGPVAVAPEELAGRLMTLGAAPLTVGDGAVRFRACLAPAGARIPADDSPLHRVGALHVCRLGAAVAPTARAALVPDYLRPPDATPTAARPARSDETAS